MSYVNIVLLVVVSLLAVIVWRNEQEIKANNLRIIKLRATLGGLDPVEPPAEGAGEEG